MKLYLALLFTFAVPFFKGTSVVAQVVVKTNLGPIMGQTGEVYV